MSVAPYSSNSAKTRRSRRTDKTTNEFAAKLESKKSTLKNVAEFKPATTDELKNILWLEKASYALTFVLVLTTLGIYAWTVYAPKLWIQEYKKLEKLQRHERNLIANNETLKNSLAEQAENPATGLTDVHPFQSIFIPSTKTTASVVKKSGRLKKDNLDSNKTFPLEQATETPVSY